jgi:Tfp pilus assembly protein PilF
MSPKFMVRLVVLLLAIVSCTDARGADPAHPLQLRTVIIPRKVSSTKDRAREAVQRTETFILWDANKPVKPCGVGFIYLVEKIDGDRLLLSEPSEGLRGWVHASAVVPLTEAEPYFSGLINVNPRNTFALLMRGVVRHETDDLDQAFVDLDAALRLDPKSVSTLIERASLWQWRNRLDQAVADVSKAIEFDPKNSFAYVERGVFEYNMKKYDECLADFKQAIDLGSKAAVIHVCQGMIHLARKDPIKAKAEFESALQIDPKHADAYAGLASIFLLRSETSKALTVLDEAVRADPRSPDSYGNRAVVLLSRHEYQKALADLDGVLRLAPNSARALRERGWILATCPDPKVRDGEQAVVLATRACELTGWKEPHCLTTLAAACSEKADFDNAQKWQQKAIDLLAEKSPEIIECRKALARYKSKKPNHPVGLLEEMGVRAYHQTTK